MRSRPVALKSIVGKKHQRLVVSLCVCVILLVALTVSLASIATAVTPSFPDVPATHPYYAAISDLASRGIINGLANGNFGPGDSVTRQQFAKMIVLTGGYPVSEADVCAFSDVQKGGYSDPLFPDNYIAVCAAQGITTGKTPSTFDPSGKLTRYQGVSMVVRAASNLQPGLLVTPPAGYAGAWAGDAVHGANAALAEYNGLLAGLDLAGLTPTGNMSRGEVAQVLHNLLTKLSPATTTTTSPATTSTTSPATGLTWSGWLAVPGGGTTDAAPAVTVYNNKLVLFAKGITDQKIYANSYDGTVWSGWLAVPGGGTTDAAPAATVFNNKLVLFAKGITDQKIYAVAYDGSAWSGWLAVPGGGTTDAAPAVTVFNNKLVLFAKGITDQKIYAETYDGSAWSGWLAVPGGGTTDAAPAATVFDNKLALFAKGITDQKIYADAYDGSAWSGWLAVPGGGTTDTAPAVTVFNGKLVLFAKGITDQKIYVNVCTP